MRFPALLQARFVAIVLAGTLMLAPGLALADSIGFSPEDQSVVHAALPSVNIIFDRSGGSYLGDFDLNILFSDALLNFTGGTYGTLLGDEGLGEAIYFPMDHTPGSGVINIAGLSLLVDPNDPVGPLTDLQDTETEWLIATLFFSTVGIPGTSPLTFGINAVGNELGESVATALSFGDGSITIRVEGSPSPIPEPGTLLLLGTGLSGLLLRRRKQKQLAR